MGPRHARAGRPAEHADRLYGLARPRRPHHPDVDCGDGAAGYDIFRKLSTDPTFPITPLIQVGAVTTVQNINVDPGTHYDYAIRATNGLGPSDLSAAVYGHRRDTDLRLSGQFRDGRQLPGHGLEHDNRRLWCRMEPSLGVATVSQTGTATGDPKKAYLRSVSSTASSTFIVRGSVAHRSWASGEFAPGRDRRPDHPTTGKGYNLVLTGRFSNTGVLVGGSKPPGTQIINPRVEFLDDGVAGGPTSPFLRA